MSFKFRIESVQQILLVLTLLVWSQVSMARVFDFSNEGMAPFLNLRGGMRALGRAPTNWQDVDGWGGEPASTIYGGEMGMRWWSQPLGFSVGLLVQKIAAPVSVTGLNSSGQNLFTAQTEALAYGPTFNIDAVLYQEGISMWRLFVGGGYQYAKVDNTYQVSSAGQTLWGVSANVQETLKATMPHLTLGVGAEFLLAKSSTLSVQLGYHHTLSGSWSHGRNGESLSGATTNGSAAVFEDGSNRTIPWSYLFLQVGFQFYVETLR